MSAEKAKKDKTPKQAKGSPKGGKAPAAPKKERATREPEPKTVRLQEHYRLKVHPEMLASGEYKNPMAVPRIMKITVNMGIGRATENRNLIETATRELGQITGQRPAVTRARKSVAGFKLRQGQAIGCKVTLRGKRMYEFMDRDRGRQGRVHAGHGRHVHDHDPEAREVVRSAETDGHAVPGMNREPGDPIAWPRNRCA
jgi:large subunit ribosomal protein L5